MPRRVLAPLIATFVLAVACFLTSTWYSSDVSSRITRASARIATEAIPSIVQLAETRSELRQLDLAARLFEPSRADRERDRLAAARGDVDAAFGRFLALPTAFAGERARRAAIRESEQEVDRAVSDLVAGAAGGPEVTRAVDAASDAIRDTIVFDADHAGELAAAIDRDRGHAVAIAWTLDALSALLTALVAFLAVRGLLLYQRQLASSRRLLEERAGELELFAARVAHDVVSPLAVTRISVESALDGAPEPLARKLRRARSGVDRVVAMVDGLLAFARSGARPDAGDVTDVGELARGVVDELQASARGAGIRLSLVAAPACCVLAHPGVVASIVENLASNAIKYVGDRADARVEVRVRAADRAVRIEVRDNGPGVPEEIRDTLWDPHVRGRHPGQPGIGLGLATVKRIVRAHDGRYGVESQLGEGSLFWCELPRAPVLGPHDGIVDALRSKYVRGDVR